MTVAGIDISPSANITLSGLTFQNNFQDAIIDAANTTITNFTSVGAKNGALSLVGTTGITTLTNVNISGASLFGLRVTNPGGTHNITHLVITGAPVTVSISWAAAELLRSMRLPRSPRPAALVSISTAVPQTCTLAEPLPAPRRVIPCRSKITPAAR
jgi:hypothetical protein